ncbi:MAG: hypothetical protein ABIJ75_02340 [Actinomycetota bacterium]
MGAHLRRHEPPGTAAPPRLLGVLALATGAALLAAMAAGCSGSPQASVAPDPPDMVPGGSWYVREHWPHDGNPYETEHFVVYSDGAGQPARERLGVLAEEVWAEVIDVMGFDPATMFRFPQGQDKIDLYANRYHVLEGGGARAYYAGVIIPSFDHEAGPENTSVPAIRVTLKHELVHVAEALLKGRFVGDVPVADPRRMPVWFSEGTAEALSGGSTGGAPRTLNQMNGLIEEYGRINPIAWRVDIPMSDLAPGAYPNYYYPMAHLAVAYLLDPGGLGKSPEDLTAVMVDMGEDVPFDDAFENHIGISQSDYEAEFFARIDAYLPQSEFPFEAVGLGLVSLLAAGVMGGSLVRGLRRRPAAAAGRLESGVPAPARRARTWFVAEMATASLLAVGFTTLLLFAISFNRPQGANPVPGYAVAAGFFIGSVGIETWAMRRWGARRGAHLIPLLVVASVVVTIVLIDLIY